MKKLITVSLVILTGCVEAPPEGCYYASSPAVVSPEQSDMDRMRSLFARTGRYGRPGTYTRLVRAGYGVIMSDTHDEISDHFTPIRMGRDAPGGVFLINGLGIGMVADNILKLNPDIRVRVIEIDADVIALVAPHYQKKYGDRFEVIHADAFEYRPAKGEQFAGIWHDIWPSICADNLAEMTRLHRKYARRTKWQGSWCKYECKRAAA